MSHVRSNKSKQPAESKTQDVFAKRRKKLLDQFKNNQLIIIPAHAVSQRNRDVEYLYHQDSNFYYLTGFNEPESIAVLAPGRKEGEYILFNRPKDPEKETWTGKHAGLEGAISEYGADQAFPISEFKKRLSELLKKRTTIFYTIKDKRDLDKDIEKTILNIKPNGLTKIKYDDISATLAEMRLIKDDEEIALIKKSIDISKKGHLAAMQNCRPGMYEYQLEAKLMHEFLDNGSQALSYPNIVASGENSCTLHYEENNKQIKEGDLVLIDAGAEYHNYSSDITRTFPANGKFTKEQRAIYDLVLKAQQEAIKCTAPGITWTDIETVVATTLTQGLIDLGILKGDLETLFNEQAYKPFYMHGSGHWMGLDVHDVGEYDIPFEVGMIHTIEPGIYIKPSPDVDKRWHNIGVRIEDDILITKDGCEVLSRALPSKAEEIEALMSKSRADNDFDGKSSTAKSLATLKRLDPIVIDINKNKIKEESENAKSINRKPRLFKQPHKTTPAPDQHEPIATRLRSRNVTL